MKKKIVSILVLVAILAFFVYYVITNRSDFEVFAQTSPSYVAIIACLYALFLVVNGAFLRVIIRDFGIALSFIEYTAISVLTTFGNTFLPFRGGAGFRAVYLKKRYNFSYTHFMASLAGNYIIVFAVASFLALVGIAVLYAQKGYTQLPVTIIFASILVGTTVVIIVSPKEMAFIPIAAVRDRVKTVLEGWHIIRSSRRTVITLILLTVVNLSLIAGMMLFEFRALGITSTDGTEVTFFQAFFFGAVNTLSLFVSITPASLGIREGLMMLVSSGVGIDPSHALAISMLDRAVTFFLLLLLAPVAGVLLKRRENPDGARYCGE